MAIAFTFFVLLFGVSGALAEQDGGPPTYHEIKNCEGRRGVAVYYFTNLPFHRMDLSDICLTGDRTLQAIEPLSDLVLVGQRDFSDQFEDASSASTPSKRRRLNFRSFETKAPFGYGQEVGGLQISLGPDRPEKWGAKDYWAKGYAFNKLYSGPSPTREFQVNGDLFVVDQKSQRHGLQRPTFVGALTFENGRAAATFEDYGGTSKSMEFSVDLKLSESGNISGTGTMTFENQRLTDLESENFKTARFDFDRFVGHVVGKDATEMKIIGIGRGVYVDQTGNENTIDASVEISGFVKP
ncbi:MAG: hypothetical protein JJ979_18730 [Roseibium sp.]|nr:hypothetical protein [Roseibium sp.]